MICIITSVFRGAPITILSARNSPLKIHSLISWGVPLLRGISPLRKYAGDQSLADNSVRPARRNWHIGMKAGFPRRVMHYYTILYYTILYYS